MGLQRGGEEKNDVERMSGDIRMECRLEAEGRGGKRVKKEE